MKKDKYRVDMFCYLTPQGPRAQLFIMKARRFWFDEVLVSQTLDAHEFTYHLLEAAVVTFRLEAEKLNFKERNHDAA